MLIEIIGLIASLVTLLSFCVNGEAKIRIINSIGCIIFIIYGVLIHAPSIYFVNSMIFIINIRRGKKLLGKVKNY